jgi:hypothetical protein
MLIFAIGMCSVGPYVLLASNSQHHERTVGSFLFGMTIFNDDDGDMLSLGHLNITNDEEQLRPQLFEAHEQYG